MNYDADLEILYKYSMGVLIKRESKTYNKGIIFLSQEEFEKNEHIITQISGAHRRLQDKLKIK